MNQFFNADLVTLRSLFTNEYNATDRGKNYYIPLYQREYKWDKRDITKLFDDLWSVCSDKQFDAYFLGGIVLSRSSMEGEERSQKSLEVIDGQQRLTTLAILLAIIIQCLKFENRNYIDKKDYVDSLINDLTQYIISKRFDKDYKAIWVLKVERSDNLKDFYYQMITDLINKKFVYTTYKNLVDEEKDFFLKVKSLHQKIKKLKNDELLHFTTQLLDFTQMVITKTDSFETGYLVFEKLNDSGKNLEAHELLKNYLFSLKNFVIENLSKEEISEIHKVENTKLKVTWEKLVNQIDEIEPKLNPKTFLEYYLIIIGKDYKNSTTTYIFKEYRDYFETHIDERLEILEKMLLIANKFNDFKESLFIKNTLNALNFKLGFLILLSFYHKYQSEYLNYEKDLIRLIFRLGYVHLLIEKIKPMNKIIKELCSKISTSKNVQDCFIKLEEDINELILKEKDKFIESLSDVDRFNNRDHFVKLLFSMINLKDGLDPINTDNYYVERIMPEDYTNCDYSFENISKDNVSKFANLIGNLIIYDENKNNLDMLFKERYSKICSLNEISINNINKFIDIDEHENWGKFLIEKRNKILTNLAVEFFINNKLELNKLTN